MTEPAAPLAHLAGAVPPAPAWFTRAMADAPERRHVDVDGTRIETLVWGERGRPGLLFLHGNAATADLWRFVAPFFSATHRVGALSWSGAGGSDWRSVYTVESFVREIMVVSEELGLFDAPSPPVLVSHSAGSRASLWASHLHGERFGATVVVDSLLVPYEHRGTYKAHRVYPTLAEALARFRFAPPQPVEHLFLVDMIARASLREVPGGWSWRFDPKLFGRFPGDGLVDVLGEMRCPIAFLVADRSAIVTPERLAWTRDALPPTTPFIVVPESHHHVMVDQPLAFVSVLRTLLATYRA